jgi:hypothetical protein
VSRGSGRLFPGTKRGEVSGRLISGVASCQGGGSSKDMHHALPMRRGKRSLTSVGRGGAWYGVFCSSNSIRDLGCCLLLPAATAPAARGCGVGDVGGAGRSDVRGGEIPRLLI